MGYPRDVGRRRPILNHATAALQQSGFHLSEVQQFSASSWDIAAKKSAKYL